MYRKLILFAGIMHLLSCKSAEGMQEAVILQEGGTPLHVAAYIGNLGLVKALLADIETTDKKGRTPLHLAARSGQFEVVRLLLASGAHQGVKDNKERTALDYAVLNNNFEVTTLLINSLAS